MVATEKTPIGERDDVWTGVLPVYEVLGDPVESGICPERPVQREIIDWMEKRNTKERAYAEQVAKPEMKQPTATTNGAEKAVP